MRLTTLPAFLALAAPAFAGGSGEPTQAFVDLGCAEFDRYEELTPNDTLSLITSVHNPEHARGFVVVYAVDELGEPISFNNLAGQMMAINGIDRFEYSVNAVDFRSPVAEGEITDLDADGIRDLDDSEYEYAPDELLVPRFIGQGGGGGGGGGGADVDADPFRGRLVLVDLTSGADFDTTVDFLIYNDNEEVFSGEYTFNCWERPRLRQISGAFGQGFLANLTDQDENESAGGRETGWFRMQGAVANSVAHSVVDPAVYGVYIEQVGGYAAADLPFEAGAREGSILPRSIHGDADSSGGSEAVASGDNIARRKPGSLLLYPEFNNLAGNLTLLTVTNVSATDDVRVHFVYRGKYGALGN